MALDEKLQRNASKFAMFSELENPNSFFLIGFSISKNMANFGAYLWMEFFIDHKPQKYWV